MRDERAMSSYSVSGESDSVKRYFDRPSGDSQQPLADPLKFNPSDCDYRLWCNCRILHGFFLITFVQAFFVCGIILASIGHLIYEQSKALQDDSFNSTSFIEAGPSSVLNESFNGRSAKLIFEINGFFPYFRLLMALIELAGLIIAYYGVWSQQPRLITPLIATGVLAIFASLIYVLMLTWHCVKKQDYFTFCFVGLTLLFLLLANVLGVHCAVELRTYLYDLSRFVASARRRWPNVVQAVITSPDSGHFAASSRSQKKQRQLKKGKKCWYQGSFQSGEYNLPQCHGKGGSERRSPAKGYLNQEYMIQAPESHRRSMDIEAAEAGSSGLGSSTQDPEVFGGGSNDDEYRSLRNNSGDSGVEASCSRSHKEPVVECIEEDFDDHAVVLHLREDWLSKITPKASVVYRHYYISRALVARARLERKRYDSTYDLDSEDESEYDMERGHRSVTFGSPCGRYSRSALPNEETVSIQAVPPNFSVKDICVPI